MVGIYLNLNIVCTFQMKKMSRYDLSFFLLRIMANEFQNQVEIQQKSLLKLQKQISVQQHILMRFQPKVIFTPLETRIQRAKGPYSSYLSCMQIGCSAYILGNTRQYYATQVLPRFANADKRLGSGLKCSFEMIVSILLTFVLLSTVLIALGLEQML